jgi:hypothetical membrane protein
VSHRARDRHWHIYGFLAIAGFIAPIALVLTDAVNFLSLPWYNPIVQSISDLAWSPLGWLQTLVFFVFSFLIMVMMLGIYAAIRGGIAFRIGVILFIIIAFSFLLVGSFHNNYGAGADTVYPIIHLNSARVVGILFPIASLLIATGLRRNPEWKHLYPYTLATGIIALGLTVSLVIGPSRSPEPWPWFGLCERLLTVNGAVWFEVMAVRLWLLARTSR